MRRVTGPPPRRSFWRRYRWWIVGQAVVWIAGAATLRAAIVPAEECPPVGATAIGRGIDEGAAWLVRGQRDGGRFLYGYHADTGAVNPGYNSTRHAGVMDALYRLGRTESADAGLAFVRRNLIARDDWAAFAPAGEDANVGGNSLLVVALLHRREATGETRYDPLIHRLARFVLSQARADGSVLQYWSRETGRPVPDVTGKFATGEAFYALAFMNAVFPGEGWEEPARRVVDYLATRRDVAEGNTVRPSDHWAAYGLATLAPAGLSEVEVDYARLLSGYFGFLVRLESQRVGRALNPFSESGASLGTVGEGTTALWRLAGEEPRLADLRDDLGERSACLAGILVERQAAPSSPDPRERGAWFADGYTQMDDQQHAVAALLGAGQALP